MGDRQMMLATAVGMIVGTLLDLGFTKEEIAKATQRSVIYGVADILGKRNKEGGTA